MYVSYGMVMNRYNSAFYIQALDKYMKTGECAKTDSEPLYAYLLSVMNDAVIKIQVLNNDICACVFYDTMVQFINLNLNKEKYNLQKSQAEQEGMEHVMDWSIDRRRDGWQALLKQLGDAYQEFGFDHRFYRAQFGQEGKYADDKTWEKMIDDWKEAFHQKNQKQKEEEIELRKDSLEQRMRSNFKKIPEYLDKNKVEKDEFFQSWGLMNGIWNTFDFERIRKIVRIQKEFPEILKIANKMGRIAADDGQEQLSVAEGDIYKMEHASKCDILGITIGNDLNSLLPIELAHCADTELENLFVYKYLTGKLQNFRYKSEIMKPAKRLEVRPAALKGPMIVCLDTSGSMVGKPEKIAYSLMVKLLEIADRQRRDCFLIAFSVSVNPIDVRRERARLLDFFSTTACGDTDATRMLNTTFQLLLSNKDYMNADILWISDFKIPLSSPKLIRQMQEYRDASTRFYGLQIGIAENEWASFFDYIYQISYTPVRRY
ncbi:hypothetical protein [Bacteroides sp.]|uniref:hypothetical protein n=1 Tax=Bacteroides sp. TaxID=29523 RepID=UPI00261C1736|nr:hypothetical protein [Bacteroides sp.]MDD3037593.1 hypothetical protein [Bacteroides sp.]